MRYAFTGAVLKPKQKVTAFLMELIASLYQMEPVELFRSGGIPSLGKLTQESTAGRSQAACVGLMARHKLQGADAMLGDKQHAGQG